MFATFSLTLSTMSFGDTDDFDDWDAARRATRGDSSAFGRLYDRHSSDLFKFLASRLGQPTPKMP